MATVMVESVPEGAGQVVESLAQVDPELVEEWVEEIVEAVPAVADEMNEAMATTLATEEEPSTV